MVALGDAVAADGATMMASANPTAMTSRFGKGTVAIFTLHAVGDV